MKPIQRLFVFGRKELLMLFMIGFMISVFTFTLGIHYGKHVGNRIWVGSNDSVPLVTTLPDQIPDRQELAEQGKGAQRAVVETLHHDLQAEVIKTGIKLSTPRQVDLPHHPKKPEAGATTLTKSAKPSHTGAHLEKKKENATSHPKYTLQIGSFPNREEATKQLSAMKKSDLNAYLKEAEVKGKGKRYRLYLGDYINRADAEHAGDKFRSQRKISSFIVTRVFD
jgi:cell division septation protein DedD